MNSPWLRGFVVTWIMPMPLFGLALVLAAALALLGRRRVGLGLAGIAVAGLLALSWQPVSESLLRPLEQRHPYVASEVELQPAEVIVVLGAGLQYDMNRPLSAQLTQSSAVRLLEGLRLAALHPEARLLLCGGARHWVLLPVAQGYANMALALGVDPERITVLAEAIDTAQEARAVRAEVDPGARMLLVTSASHMPRAMGEFRRLGLAPVAVPTDHMGQRSNAASRWRSLPSATQLRKSERALHEYMGLLALHLRDRSDA